MSSDKKLSYSDRGKLGYEASLKARRIAGQQRRSEYDKNPVCCKCCGNAIPFSKRKISVFCSSSCAAKFNNRTRAGIERVCEKCGSKFNAKSGNTKYCPACKENHSTCVICKKVLSVGQTKYCSTACAAEARHKQRQERLMDYISRTGEFPTHGGTLTKGETNRNIVRAYLEAKHGHVCSVCGLSSWNNCPIPLVVDHIDGNPYNHKVNNFRLICCNCDAQSPTYKGKNLGKGRTYRRSL